MNRPSWAPMHDPPLPTRNDPMLMTCEHAFREEDCYRNGGVHTLDELEGDGADASVFQGTLDGTRDLSAAQRDAVTVTLRDALEGR
ncbi:hypothetical protein [Pseudoclavibacter sp. 8L]|uniref:hypothetical protein n=1 Tax=Pseudoclavibacter sp. 8L TaxID=2653162 RepID=UPI0012F0EC5B|nr:hypothetical protein [Pseudoclavibacter sp. 8L]VXB75568.1 hypothetical protein PSCLAVI8L_180158 [Pseudoclavibacter sp. 8L]